MNFRSSEHFISFSGICRDTWRIRRVPGRVFRGDSRGCRAVSEWSLGLGHAAQPEASGGISLIDLAAHSGIAGGIRASPGVSLGTHGDSEGSRG